MSLINPLAREISIKIVYYGPGLSGKTTSLSYIHSTLKPSHRGSLISLATEGDRTLFFDFLPVKIRKVHDMDVRLQLYTVPGQVFYGATRKLVLEGADAVIFVADSQRDALDRNIESLNDLQNNLRETGSSLSEIPFVLQYNKRDLPQCLSHEELRAHLNRVEAPDFSTIAQTGEGVVDSLKTVTKLTIDQLSREPEPSSLNGSRRRALAPPVECDNSSLDGGFEGQVRQALSSMSEISKLERPSESSKPSRQTEPSPSTTANTASRAPSGRHSNGVVDSKQPESLNDLTTINAPAPQLSFAELWEDGAGVSEVENGIVNGRFAEAIYRAASHVSEMLERLLGPHGPEGSGSRAQLLGLDGHEYLKLRRLCSRPASELTKQDALFALYILVALRIKESRI